MKKVAVMPSSKGNLAEESLQIISWLEEHNLKVMLPEGKGYLIGCGKLETPGDLIRKTADLMISLGGDGTLLSACRITAGTSIPILGINLGNLGFLTEVSFTNWENTLERILTGEYSIEDRMMLECQVRRDGEAVFRGIALNDVVVSHGGEMSLLKLGLKISENYAGTYSADGIILATPTGSTAYSLSAGGPVVNPAMECIILTAICPHTLSARPLVIPPGEVVEITERSDKRSMLSLDGQENFNVNPGDAITVKRSSSYTSFIHIGKKFYTTIREKLKWFE
jgi:NAD+ kinase